MTDVIGIKTGKDTTLFINGNGLIAQEDSKGNYHSYHYDYRGSTVALTDRSGKTTDQMVYGTYGELLKRTGTTKTPFLYSGRDGIITDSNGLYYMRARFYNPELKRFVNQDVLTGSISDSTSLNRFSYVNGDPVGKIDPSGMVAAEGSNYSDDPILSSGTSKNRNKKKHYYKGMWFTDEEWSNLNRPRQIYISNTCKKLPKGMLNVPVNFGKLLLNEGQKLVNPVYSVKANYNEIMGFVKALNAFPKAYNDFAKLPVEKQAELAGSWTGENIPTFITEFLISKRIVKKLNVKSGAIGKSNGLGSTSGSKTVNVNNSVLNNVRTGSALKGDALHAFNDIVDNYAGYAQKFEIVGGDKVKRALYQIEGTLNGKNGIFEWIVDPDVTKGVTHRRFIEGVGITGKPNAFPKK